MSAYAPELPADLVALKAMTRALVSAVGGPDVAGRILKKKACTITNYGSENEPGRQMPPLDIMRLERNLGRPFFSDWMRDRVTLDPDRPRRQIAIEDVAKMAKESSEAIGATVTALSDGRIDELDRLNVAREVAEARDLFSELHDLVVDAA